MTVVKKRLRYSGNMGLHGIDVIYLDVCRCNFLGNSLDSVVILVWVCVMVDKSMP